jgi:hypothetical protein
MFFPYMSRFFSFSSSFEDEKQILPWSFDRSLVSAGVWELSRSDVGIPDPA